MAGRTDYTSPRFFDLSGFTLIELILVVVIIGLLATTAVRTGGELFKAAKVEEARQELDALAIAIVGNPALVNNGVRADFGYVGDVGALPPNFDALYTNPGGYATWQGPYITNHYAQAANDFKTDPWGTVYAYGGVALTSTGSGSSIVRQIAGSSHELLHNSSSGIVLDSDGTPPGSVYCDSVSVSILYPNGTGSTTLKTVSPDAGGYFDFDSIPIGNHSLIIVCQPESDTLYRLVSVSPATSTYAEYRFAANIWHGAGTGGRLALVAGSDSLKADCHGCSFWIVNGSGGPVDISSLTLTWTGPPAYYRYVRWNSTTVFDESNPANGSGDRADFATVQTINDGQSIRIEIDSFRSNPTGGPNVDIENITFTVLMSDGSTFAISTGVCP